MPHFTAEASAVSVLVVLAGIRVPVPLPVPGANVLFADLIHCFGRRGGLTSLRLACVVL
ncbi:MAG: hypothetical protein AAGA95_01485 [Pseudomonadota bacterium]